MQVLQYVKDKLISNLCYWMESSILNQHHCTVYKSINHKDAECPQQNYIQVGESEYCFETQK